MQEPKKKRPAEEGKERPSEIKMKVLQCQWKGVLSAEGKRLQNQKKNYKIKGGESPVREKMLNHQNHPRKEE